MSLAEYQICTRCIMDTSDPFISFDVRGLCNHCQNFDSNILPQINLALEDDTALNKISKTIRTSSSSNEFNCIIGLSGGLDSSYVAYLAKEKMGLSPLLFHVDAGWNTDQAVGNIEKIVDGLGLDLYTDVVDWQQIRKVQVAFLRSGISDQDLVQDAVFFSGLYKFAQRYGIKHIITGSNFSTECCREPEAWGGYLGIDKTLFKDIWRCHGDGSTFNLPIVDILRYKIFYQQILGMKVHHPLNSVKYYKKDAENELFERFGWLPFKHKHHESRFTRFYEDYWLPRRFGYEKRRAHFSSLIMTKQLTRTEALARISKSEMSEDFLKHEFEYISNKLELDVSELNSLFQLPWNSASSFKNKRKIIKLGARILKKVGLEKRNLS